MQSKVLIIALVVLSLACSALIGWICVLTGQSVLYAVAPVALFVLVLLVLWVVTLVRARMSANQLEKGLMAQAEAQARSARPDQKQQVVALQRDFDEITRLLSEMLDDVQDRLARVSPWMGILDRLGARSDEEICTFCISGARDLAWRWAERFAGLQPTALNAELNGLDQVVTLLSTPIRRPAPLLATALAVVRVRETSDVAKVVAALT